MKNLAIFDALFVLKIALQKQFPLNCNLCQKDAILTTLSHLFAVISH